MALQLPRFIVVESFDQTGYLSYIHEGGEADGFMRFMEPQVTSPFAKLEVESSETDGLVHIRSCHNNKYWQRTYLPTVPWGPWIAATSKEKEEDKSNTLFRFIPIDPANKKFRIKHVRSGCYLCSPRMEDPKFDHGLLAHHNEFDEFDHQTADVFTIIDWSLLLILPRHLAFMGDNGMYMSVNRISKPGFYSRNIDAFEILPTNDGNIRIKSPLTGEFFRCKNSCWVYADEPSADNADTLFRPVKISDQKIALFGLSNNTFFRMSPRWKDPYCSLETADTYVTREAQITVVKPVMTSEIHDVKYDVHNSRVHAKSAIVVAHNSVTNITDEPSNMDVKLGYKDTKTSRWETDFSVKLGTATPMKFDVPLIFERSVKISSQVQSEVEWGKVFETTTDLEDVHTVTVPPMSMVTVNLVAIKGLCEVPFTFMQNDTLYDRRVVSEVQGGTYYGSNYHSMKIEVKAEPLPPGSKK